MRKVAIVASASGNGKTTLGRELARRLDVPFVELDALVHGPNWVETPDDELREQVEPLVAADGWVIDGTYRSKLGDLVLEHADVVVWLDLPIRVWLPRLTRRTWRRIRGREQLWNDNTREPSGCALGPRVALRLGLPDALRPAQALCRAARALSSRTPALAARGRALARERPQVTGCYLAFVRRDCHSATQAAARRPSQSGVSST